jgi:hypothetical protein
MSTSARVDGEHRSLVSAGTQLQGVKNQVDVGQHHTARVRPSAA